MKVEDSEQSEEILKIRQAGRKLSDKIEQEAM